eukprot:151543-Rhodomonas_salina.1
MFALQSDPSENTSAGAARDCNPAGLRQQCAMHAGSCASSQRRRFTAGADDSRLLSRGSHQEGWRQ